MSCFFIHEIFTDVNIVTSIDIQECQRNCWIASSVSFSGSIHGAVIPACQLATKSYVSFLTQRLHCP